MKKILKSFAISLGGLVALIVVAVAAMWLMASNAINKSYNVQVETIAIPTDAESIAEGEHWAQITGCTGCHGENLAGQEMLNDPVIGRVTAHNLTAGRGGIGGGYTDDDWVRALRHGVNPEGKSVFLMPSTASYYFSDEDLGNLIAYLKSVPPVNNDAGGKSLTPMAYILYTVGMFGELRAAELIDHGAARPAVAARGTTAEYGAYLALVSDCRICHGRELAGGPSPEPGGLPGPNLTPGGHVGEWSEHDFIEAMRTGILPAEEGEDHEEGEQMDDSMPWRDIGRMTDEELSALYLYLHSLPALEDAVEEKEAE